MNTRTITDSTKTFFLDIDGTLIYQDPVNPLDLDETNTEDLPGTEKVREWYDLGHVIILTTARPEEYRSLTESQLKQLDIPFDQLVMGIGRNTRILINNESTHFPYQRRAVAYEVGKNEGIYWIEE